MSESQAPKKSSRWLPVLVIIGVLGGGVVLFMLFFVLPAVLFLRAEEQDRARQQHMFEVHRELELPESDGSEAPDFFDDLQSDDG